MPRPFPVSLRLDKKNRNSIAALLSVLEDELPSKLIEPRLIEQTEDFDGDGLLVCSFMSCARTRAASELAAWRARFGDRLQAIAGGCHASADPAGTLALGFRWVATGEAGTGFAQLVRDLAEGRHREPGVLVAGGAPPLDRYPPWPASGRLFAHVEITRGCPMACAFCQTPRLFGRTPRHRSLESIRRTFEHAAATGHRYTRFVAPNAFGYGSRDAIHSEPAAIEALLTTTRTAGIEEIYLGTFPSEVWPTSVTPELLQLVKDHCANRSIALGLQSGSADVLRAIRRGHTVEQGVAAVRAIAQAGFVPKVDFIFGFPGESDADREKTRTLIAHLVTDYGATIHAHLFEPLPGTPLAGATPSALDGPTRALIAELAGSRRLTGLDASELDEVDDERD
ncbi:MAG: TIGR04013 family B12-binding domain/radical SAM domain-containing protein [Deltaproteobacteria bacterium]|nr:TIGR04013 family B12-binding domain/radical SAM domain-containing protein [Deltaproteobacteria bacterium]